MLSVHSNCFVFQVRTSVDEWFNSGIYKLQPLKPLKPTFSLRFSNSLRIV